MRRTLVVLALVAACVGAYVWWRRLPPAPPAPSAAPDAATTLRVQVGAEPSTLDPALARTLPEALLVLNLYEGLYTFDPQTLEPRPAIAESAEVSADGLTWTLRLREAHWSNGDQVTPEDFVWSWERARAPAMRAPYAHLFAPIREVSSDGARRLVVSLHAPTPGLPSLLCFPPFLPLHRRTVEQAGAEWTSPGRLVTNGPFFLRARRWQQWLLLERSATYREAPGVRLPAVQVFTSANASRALEAYDSGAVDWGWAVPEKKAASVHARKDWRSSPRLAIRFLRFNTRGAPFQDPRVRRAVSLAIDRDAVAGDEAPTRSLVPPGMPGYEASRAETDEEKARVLLEEAGYPRGAGLPPVELACEEGEATSRLAAAVAARLQATLGMVVRVVPESTEAHLAAERDAGFRHMSLSLWGADFVDPAAFLGVFVSAGADNRTGWGSRWYDELVGQATLTADPAARADLWRQAERVLVQDEAPIAPLASPREGFLLRDRVKGVWANGLGVHPLRDAWLEPPAGDQ